MKNILTIATAVLTLAWGSSSHAAIMIDVDTATDLTGSWFFEDGESSVVSTLNFGDLLPDGINGLFGSRSAFTLVEFGTSGFGFADDPYFIGFPGAAQLNFPESAGSYTNNPLQTEVFFRFYNMVDTGEDDGAFEGDFCFSTTRVNLDACDTPPPIPAPAVPALLGLGLVLLRLSRRSCAA